MRKINAYFGYQKDRKNGGYSIHMRLGVLVLLLFSFLMGKNPKREFARSLLGAVRNPGGDYTEKIFSIRTHKAVSDYFAKLAKKGIINVVEGDFSPTGRKKIFFVEYLLALNFSKEMFQRKNLYQFRFVIPEQKKV